MEELIDRPEPKQEEKYGPKRFRSDVLRWIIIGLFLLGLIVRNRHWPGSGISLVGALLLSTVYAVWQIIEGNVRGNTFKGMFGALFALAVIYLGFRLQYYPGAGILLVLALMYMFVLLLYLGVHKRQKEFDYIVLFACALCVGLSTVSDSSIYYGTKLSQTLNSHAHEHSYVDWDNYSYLLLEEGKKEEALEANSKAMQIVLADGWDDLLPELEMHRNEILFGTK